MGDAVQGYHRILKRGDVQVYKDGKLFSKTSVLSPRRACNVELQGTQLTISWQERGQERVYELANARLLKQEAQKRIILQLASKEKVSLCAANKSDLEDWIEALGDSIEWRVQRFYDIGPELGHGAFATVRKGRNKSTREIVAIKIINKSCCKEEELRYLHREVDIARSLHHRNVVRTLGIFESEHRLYLIQEYMSGGTLERFISRNGPQTEEVAWQIMSDILWAVSHLHRNDIVHRNLKPQNVLCSGKKAPMTAKLVDFGLSRHTAQQPCSSERSDSDGIGPEGLTTTPVGTPGLVAPEVLMNVPYGKEVDMFACGVIMYFILSGYLPSYHAEAGKLAELTKEGECSFLDKNWEGVSISAKDLISRMLERSPYSRITAEEALHHSWMKAAIAAEIRRRKTVRARADLQLDYVDEEIFTVRTNAPFVSNRALSDENMEELNSPRSVGAGQVRKRAQE